MERQDTIKYVEKLIKINRLSAEYKKQHNLKEFNISLYDNDNAIAVSMNNGESKLFWELISKDIAKKLSEIIETAYILSDHSPIYVGNLPNPMADDASTISYALYKQ